MTSNFKPIQTAQNQIEKRSGKMGWINDCNDIANIDALTGAVNVVFDQPGVIESRLGFENYNPNKNNTMQTTAGSTVLPYTSSLTEQVTAFVTISGTTATLTATVAAIPCTPLQGWFEIISDSINGQLVGVYNIISNTGNTISFDCPLCTVQTANVVFKLLNYINPYVLSGTPSPPVYFPTIFENAGHMFVPAMQNSFYQSGTYDLLFEPFDYDLSRYPQYQTASGHTYTPGLPAAVSWKHVDTAISLPTWNNFSNYAVPSGVRFADKFYYTNQNSAKIAWYNPNPTQMNGSDQYLVDYAGPNPARSIYVLPGNTGSQGIFVSGMSGIGRPTDGYMKYSNYDVTSSSFCYTLQQDIPGTNFSNDQTIIGAPSYGYPVISQALPTIQLAIWNTNGSSVTFYYNPQSIVNNEVGQTTNYNFVNGQYINIDNENNSINSTTGSSTYTANTFSITQAVVSGTNVTITASANGFTPGQTVIVSGSTGLDINGQYTIGTIVDANRFDLTITGLTDGTYTTDLGIVSSQPVVSSNAGWVGSYVIDTVNLNTVFYTNYQNAPILEVVISGSTVTITAENHGYTTGDSVGILDVTRAEIGAINGIHTCTVIDTNNFTFTIAGLTAGTYTPIFPQLIIGNSYTLLNYNSQSIVNLYLDYLGRYPATWEVSYYLAFIAGGQTLADIKTDIQASPEYANDILNGDINANTGLYTNVSQQVINAFILFLGRVPDATGVAYYVNIVNSGIAFESVILDIQNSPEYNALTKAGYIWQSGPNIGLYNYTKLTGFTINAPTGVNINTQPVNLQYSTYLPVNIFFDTTLSSFCMSDQLPVTYQLYRTPTITNTLSLGAADPGVQFQLIYQGELSNSKYISGTTPFYSYTDNSPDTQLGVSLYTDASVSGGNTGITNPNFAPPACGVMVSWNNYMMYGSYKINPIATITMQQLPGNGTFFYLDGHPIEYNVYNQGTFAENIAYTCYNLVQDINKTLPQYYAQYTSGFTQSSGSISIQVIVPEIHNQLLLASTQNIWDVDLTKSETIAGNTVVGKIYNTFKFPNFIAFSMVGAAGHVPLGNQIQVGSDNDEIMNLIPNSNTLLVVKSNSVYSVTGDAINGFTSIPVLLNEGSIAPRTTVQIDGKVYTMSKSGYSQIYPLPWTSTGVATGETSVDQAINKIIRTALSSPLLFDYAFAVADEIRHEIILTLPIAWGTNNTNSFTSLRLNVNTGLWSQISLNDSNNNSQLSFGGGGFRQADKNLYMCASVLNNLSGPPNAFNLLNPILLTKRNSGTRQDYKEISGIVNLINASGATPTVFDIGYSDPSGITSPVVYNSVLPNPPQIGSMLSFAGQSCLITNIVANFSSWTVTVNKPTNINTISSEFGVLYIKIDNPILIDIQFTPFNQNNNGYLKNYTNAIINFRDSEVTTYTTWWASDLNRSASFIVSTPTLGNTSSLDLTYDGFISNGNQPTTRLPMSTAVSVPYMCTNAVNLVLEFQHSNAGERVLLLEVDMNGTITSDTVIR